MTATAEAEISGLPPRNPQEAAAAQAATAPPLTAGPRAAPMASGPPRFREGAPPEPQDREPLFYVEHEDGTETAWTIPVVAPEYIWANALVITATRGTGVAEVYMMQEMLGEAGMAALLASKAMKREHYRWMVTKVRDKVVGPQERDPNR